MHQRKKEDGEVRKIKKKTQFGEKANPHPENQEHGRRNHHNEKRQRRRSRRVLRKNFTTTTKAKKIRQTNEDEAMKIEEKCHENKQKKPENFERIPEFTKREIQDAIGCLKPGKAGDSSGTRAEQISNCDE